MSLYLTNEPNDSLITKLLGITELIVEFGTYGVPKSVTVHVSRKTEPTGDERMAMRKWAADKCGLSSIDNVWIGL